MLAWVIIFKESDLMFVEFCYAFVAKWRMIQVKIFISI